MIRPEVIQLLQKIKCWRIEIFLALKLSGVVFILHINVKLALAGYFSCLAELSMKSFITLGTRAYLMPLSMCVCLSSPGESCRAQWLSWIRLGIEGLLV